MISEEFGFQAIPRGEIKCFVPCEKFFFLISEEDTGPRFESLVLGVTAYLACGNRNSDALTYTAS